MSNLIGSAPNQVPTNSDLGSMAFQNVDPFVITYSINLQAPAGVTTVLDSFGTGQSRTAKYVLQATYATTVYASEILLTHDGSNVYYTEYGRLSNQPSNSLAAFDAVLLNGDTISLRFTNNVGQAVTVTATRFAINS
jgi:hypothetical protein